MKLCVIYNSAPHYRVSIFKKIDEEYDCDWYFGPSYGNIKQIDYSVLKGKVTKLGQKAIGPFDYQVGATSLLFKSKYQKYLVFANTRTLSTWLIAILARFIPGKKIYFWSHGMYGKESRVETFIKKCLFKLPSGGTFVYGNYARDIMTTKGISPNKVFTIHNSLAYEQQVEIRKTLAPSDVYKKHFNNQNHNLFFVGRLTPIKKLDQVLEAMSICSKSGYYYNMTFIGDGPEKQNLELKAKELGLLKQVWFYGSCYDEKELSSLIYNADLCVAPGNIGLTAMHSMVFGTPCITHNDFPYQMPEFEAIIEGKTGTFFKRNDVKDLAERIDEWFTINGTERESIRKTCMEEIDKEWNPYFQIEVIKRTLGQ